MYVCLAWFEMRETFWQFVVVVVSLFLLRLSYERLQFAMDRYDDDDDGDDG